MPFGMETLLRSCAICGRRVIQFSLRRPRFLIPIRNAEMPYKLEMKRRRRGRPPTNAQNAIAEKVRAAAATGAKVESQIADLEKNGVSRSTTLRYRKLLGLNAKK